MTVSILEVAAAARSLPSPEVRRLLRTSAGLTQAAIASELGVDRRAVMRWEAGKAQPRGALLVRYVQLLKELRAGAA